MSVALGREPNGKVGIDCLTSHRKLIFYQCSLHGSLEYLFLLGKIGKAQYRHIQYLSLLVYQIILIFKMGVMLSFVVILFLCKRGLNKAFSNYWLKDMLIWGKGFVFVFLEKVIKVFTPSRVIWIRFDRGRPPENQIPNNQKKRLS